MPNTLTTNTYNTLLARIQKEIEGGRQIIEHTKVTTYWKIGEHISKHLLNHEERAGYGDHLLERLGKDLEVGERTLYRSVQFYREFPIPSARTELEWSHYRALLTIKDDGQRQKWQRKAVREGLSSRELQEYIKNNQPNKPKEPNNPTTLNVVRGKLNTFSIIQSENIPTGKDTVLVDLGFNIWRTIPKTEYGLHLPAVAKHKSTLAKAEDASHKSEHTYKAFVEKIIDGDTLWVQVDCGFGNFTRQKLRLRNINAPELSTKEGERAKSFVQRALRRCEFIVAKTYKSDKYDRYLADVFYLAGISKAELVVERGEFLNQRLLDENLAVKF